VGSHAIRYQATHAHIQLMINYETKINIVTILTIGQTQRVRRPPPPLPSRKGEPKAVYLILQFCDIVRGSVVVERVVETSAVYCSSGFVK